jgi:hypothetical protein
VKYLAHRGGVKINFNAALLFHYYDKENHPLTPFSDEENKTHSLVPIKLRAT